VPIPPATLRIAFSQERAQDSKNNNCTFHTSSVEFVAGDLDGWESQPAVSHRKTGLIF
jgi:hypothetical protein